MEHKAEEGILLFNTEKYFEAHEALEAVWLHARGDEKRFLHGLIQVAAAFHHHSRGNLDGFQSLLEKGMTKLDSFGASHGGINLASLREQIRPWRALLLTSPQPPPTVPPIPHIEFVQSRRGQT